MRRQEGTGKERWEREREALRKLAQVFAEEARGGLLGEALEAVLTTCRLESGAAFSFDGTSLDLVAERSGSPKSGDRATPLPSQDLYRDALTAVAKQACDDRKRVTYPEIGRSALDPELRAELVGRGAHSLVAQPVRHQREVLGVLVVMSSGALDPSWQGFLETVANIVALAVERDRRVEREVGYRAELVEAGQLASLGLLTATVAHELRGPVQALGVQVAEQEQIVSQLREAGTDWAQPMLAELVELFSDMKAATNQMSTVIGQLSSLSRRDTAPEKVELGDVARQSLGIARSELRRRGIALIEDYAKRCYTTGRRDNLVQVILNLVLNAADACATVERRDAKIVVRTRVEGPRVILSVDDTGPGVPADNVHAIFQPFFTTKERGHGTGLGLKICRDVVAAHHGHIEVVNLEGGGASFRVILPRLSVTGTSSGARPAPTLPPPGEPVEAKHVFVVDDDELFTRTVKRALKPHDVRTASTASEAEIALLDPLYAPHIVLCDLGLPGMTGDMLHARISAHRPLIAAHFIFVTGGACSKREADYLRASGCPTLIKPIDIQDIWSALQIFPRATASSEGVATLRPDTVEARISEMPTQPPEKLEPSV
ncbi:MAG TPA: ATP-binding protein [Polyangiaceae bacterium]|nr:ATP-binding protein [Polyangiaceae bacterium]